MTTENSEAAAAEIPPAAKPLHQEARLQHCQTHGDYTSLKIIGRWTECHHCSRIAIDEISERLAEERREKRLAEATVAARFPDRFTGAHFGNWDAVGDQQRAAKKQAWDYAHDCRAVMQLGRSLLLIGNVGTGKTHLAVAIGREFLRSGYAVRYTTVAGMLREVRATWNGEGRESDVIDGFVKADLLILDEVGMQRFTDSELTLIGEIIDCRYQTIKPNLLISNLPVTAESGPSVEQAIGSRALDRLRENGGKQIVFGWGSHRG